MELRPLDYTVLVVEDLDRALHFYVDLLGLAVSHRTEDFAQLFTGHTRLSFTTRPALSAWLGRPLAAPDPEAPAFELGFKVEDVDDTLTSLTERGVPVEVPATDRPWGQRCAVLRDPDGNLVELIQDLSRPASGPAVPDSEES